MQTSALLLIASLGAIAVLLMLYFYIFLFERRVFLGLWFFGWAIIALNYGLDAFHPELLRQNHPILILSLSSYFYANLCLTWGTLLFLKRKAGIRRFLGTGALWLVIFIYFLIQGQSDLHMIQFTNLTVFALFFWVGTAMIRSAKKYGALAFFLGVLDLAWIANTVLFSYILKMPQMAPYVVSQIFLLFNSIGLIQLFLKAQSEEIGRGMEHITYLTFHDELTGLYNKAYFDKALQEFAQNDDSLPVSLIVGDMNGLKFVNDVFGHQEGDNWLRRTALILKQTCRKDDIIARWGGDEFAVILPGTDRETALEIGRRIKEECKNDQGSDVLLSISLGAATKARTETDLFQVLKEAEEFMYEAKLIEGKKAKWAIAETLNRLLQKKDYEIKEHVERLEALAAEFAKALGFSRENRNNLVQAIGLHDIGKIGIPEDIVLKKTPLDETERSIMKKHVEIGYRIAHASGEFAHLADIILYHHECWDGQGYPQGLKGEEIPLLSRIISILDVFDVMTHRRSYQPARTANEALYELSVKAGSQFDPELVPVFVEMMTGLPGLLDESRGLPPEAGSHGLLHDI